MKASQLKFLLFFICLVISYIVGLTISPTYVVSQALLDVHQDEKGRLYYMSKGQPSYIETTPLEQSELYQLQRGQVRESSVKEEFILKDEPGGEVSYYRLSSQRHWGYWSLWPALVAVLLCWVIKEPVTALLGGIVSGAFILRLYDLTGEVMVPSMATVNVASILLLYLWLLGGLMGVWSRTGAAQAFAEFMTEKFVRGPRTAKLVAWMLGVIFFQGGTMSTVLVGTTVKPIADKENVSHEELAYIVDSTASPIASQLAFNAWPGYIQAFIFVSGVSFLATESDRIGFFFQSVPFCFYAILAVLSTFLLSIDKPIFLGRQLRAAVQRSRSTGQLDAPDAEPLSAKELEQSHVPQGYNPHVLEFFLPLITLIGIAIGTFIFIGSPKVQWAFGASLLVAASIALAKGMPLKKLMEGVNDGIKGVALGSIILVLAITIGGINTQTGGAIFLVDFLGESIPYFLLPVILQLVTMTIAFSTGTSWGTYAVAFPLAMPLSWAIAQSNGLEHPEFFMTLCFAAVMDGSVYGDQCSPISDTTVLSAMCTGCDLMDHVKTQIPQASLAAALAAVGWTALAFFMA